MNFLLKFLASIGKSFGISSPSDNARRSKVGERPPSPKPGKPFSS